MRRRALGAAGLVSGVLFVVFGSIANAQTPDALAFATSDPVSVSFDGQGKADPILIGVTNIGGARPAVAFSLLLSRKGAAVTNEIAVTSSPTGIDANSVSWFTITFARTAGDGDLSGFLVASDGASATAPASLPISFRTDQRAFKLGPVAIVIAGTSLPGGVDGVMLLGLILSALMVLVRAAFARFKFADVGSPKWDSKTWIGTLTVVGVALGTALKDVLPDKESAQLLSIGQYTGLHVLAAALVGLSPLIFAVLRTSNKAINGWLFLALATAVFAGAIIEVVTLLVGVADASSDIGSTLSTALGLMAIIGVVGVLIYGWQALGVGFTGPSTSENGARRQATLIKEPKPTFSLF